MIFSSKTGASVPRPPSIDSNEDRKMNFSNHRNNMDHNIPAGKFLTAPIAILEWYARLDDSEHDSIRHQPQIGNGIYDIVHVQRIVTQISISNIDVTFDIEK